MAGLPRNVLLYGRSEPPPERVGLRAGPLALTYEDGGIRHVRLGGAEVLRRAYFAVRDGAWGTVPARLSGLALERGADSFRIGFDAECVQGAVDFMWHGAICGRPDGTVEFSAEGEARSSFLANRIGFCVLHPIRECAGRPCRVEHVDGTMTDGAFPYHISPHQPFTDMRAISHGVTGGVRATVRLDGDVFEMEDQRNWTDESYKTYSTPLRLPHPVRIERGARVAQRVTLSLSGPAKWTDEDAGPVVLSVGAEPVGRLPRLGLGMADGVGTLTERQVQRLRALRLSHLRADLLLNGDGWADRLREACRQSRALGVPLEAAAFLSDDGEAEMRALRGLVERERPRVCTWLVYHSREAATSRRWLDAARRELMPCDPQAKLGGGASGNFAELNRNRPATDAADLVAYAVNAQVHAFDDASVMETLQGERWTVETARQFAGDLLLAVSPVTLRPRPRRARPGEPEGGGLPAGVDPRQMSLFGAAWTAGSVKQLAEAGVYSATYFETVGPRGAMETDAVSPVPAEFPSVPGCVFPLYHVLADVGEFAGASVLPVRSSKPLAVEGLALSKGDRTRIVLANLTDEVQAATVEGLSGRVLARRLDETTAWAAMVDPEAFRRQTGDRVEAEGGVLHVELLPYACMTLDALEGGSA